MFEKASRFSKIGAIPVLAVTGSMAIVLFYSSVVDYRSTPRYG